MHPGHFVLVVCAEKGGVRTHLGQTLEIRKVEHNLRFQFSFSQKNIHSMYFQVYSILLAQIRFQEESQTTEWTSVHTSFSVISRWGRQRRNHIPDIDFDTT